MHKDSDLVMKDLDILILLQGGALWFQDLTQLPHGWYGFIFPFLIAGLHYIIVQVMEYCIHMHEGISLKIDFSVYLLLFYFFF